MKLKKILLLFIFSICSLFAVGCSDDSADNEDDKNPVVNPGGNETPGGNENPGGNEIQKTPIELFLEARKNTIGNNVIGYEYTHSLNASATYMGVSLVGENEGNAKYNKDGQISFYDESINSGILFFDGYNYQIKDGNKLQKVTLDENNLLKKYSIEEVGANYKFDSSSFAKALFEIEDSKIKSVEETNKKGVYQVDAGFTASSAIALVGNYLNHDAIENVIGSLPETSVNTAMYVTFNDDKLGIYTYEMNINVSSIKFSLVYTLEFNSVGVAQTITPKTFAGLKLTNAEIQTTRNKINSLFELYKSQVNSSYDFELKTGVDFGVTTSEINATVKGSTKRYIDDGIVYFYNDVEIDSDFKNSDMYKTQGIDDLHYKKTMLADGTVYNIEKKLLGSNVYKVDNYNNSNADSYFLFDFFKKFDSLTYIQELYVEETNENNYIIGVSKSDTADFMSWLNDEVNINPLSKSNYTPKILGSYSTSSLELDECHFIIKVVDDKITCIELTLKGNYNTSFMFSADHAEEKKAAFDISLVLNVTTKGDNFVPFETVNDAK